MAAYIRTLFTIITLATFIQCSGSRVNEGIENSSQKYYTNPVVSYSLPDPTIIRAADGLFYLYATEDIKHLPIHSSRDLVNWKPEGTAFDESTRPTFEPDGGLWAPNIQYINEKYVLYYSMSVWGGEWTCGLGIAISSQPSGPFEDLGKLFRSNEIGVQNSIDPFFINDNDRNYLFWGSFRGIYALEMNSDGLKIKEGARHQQIAGTAYEGTYILKRNGYYYLFASIGTCCEGINSTYTTVVGRSASLLGPYEDKNGNRMMDNNHEVLIQGNERFVGTGHNANIITDDAGQDWILYHAVDKANPRGRVLMLDRILWEDNWPYVKDSTPSVSPVAAPVFN